MIITGQDAILAGCKVNKMKLITLFFFLVFVSLCGCNSTKNLPRNGPVEYPPSWPLPSVTALPGTSKAPTSRHLGFSAAGKESRWYVDGATDTDFPQRKQWIVEFFYHGKPATIYSHVEKGLNKSGFTWSPKSTRRPKNDMNDSSDKGYLIEFNNNDKVNLYVDYSGWGDVPRVKYLITTAFDW